MQKTRTYTIFDTFFLVLLLILVVGTPLVFTTYTRSVFEINKLLLLRIVTLITMGGWLAKTLIEKDLRKGSLKEILSTTWAEITSMKGLGLPLSIWIITNILSTLFSQNIQLSILGAYDRWEGIVTIINYALIIVMFSKLVTKKSSVQWLLGGLVFSTGLSAFYGVFQSLGLDFRNWSVDPTMRVFACINNPVHYCAYVGMIVPVCVGWLLYLSQQKDLRYATLIKGSVFLLTVVIYFTQFLSYSRATWMGFIAAMTLFYIFSLDLFDMRSKKALLIDVWFTLSTTAIFYLYDIFKLQEKTMVISLLFSLMIIGYILYSMVIFDTKNQSSKNSIFFYTVVSLFLMAILFVFDLSFLPSMYRYGTYFVLALGLLAISYLKHTINKKVLCRLLIIIIFAKLQFCAISLSSIFLYATAVVSLCFLLAPKSTEKIQEKNVLLILFLIIFGSIIIIPTIPSHFSALKNSNTLLATSSAKGKVHSYSTVAIEGTARTSMWKSAIPWILDYPLLGSGLDTIKYMYPKYRRSDYGILEGGHNFTPDRLHNEYLNTLATKGIIGFLSYYGLLILSWFTFVIFGFYRLRHTPERFLLVGFSSGALVYLGQVMFNFGVVATLVLFFMLVGLSLSIINHTKNTKPEEKQPS